MLSNKDQKPIKSSSIPNNLILFYNPNKWIIEPNENQAEKY